MTNMESTSNKESSQRGYVNEPVNIENSTNSTDCSRTFKKKKGLLLHLHSCRKKANITNSVDVPTQHEECSINVNKTNHDENPLLIKPPTKFL